MYALVPKDGGSSIPLPTNSSVVLGRGELLGISDKRCSRNQATISVDAAGRLVVVPGGVNPCALLSSGDRQPQQQQQLEKDRRYPLQPGDTIALLAGTATIGPPSFVYTVVRTDRAASAATPPSSASSSSAQHHATKLPTAAVVDPHDEPPSKKAKTQQQQHHHEQRDSDSSSSSSSSLPPCPYGASCYRKNPEHFREYSHSNDGHGVPRRRDTADQTSSTQQPQAPARPAAAAAAAAAALVTGADPLPAASTSAPAATAAGQRPLRLLLDDDDDDDSSIMVQQQQQQQQQAPAAAAPSSSSVPAASAGGGKKTAAFAASPQLAGGVRDVVSPAAAQLLQRLPSDGPHSNSLAFPSFSTSPEVWGFDPDRAASIACQVIASFLERHADVEQLRLLLVHPADDSIARAFRSHWRPSSDQRFRVVIGELTKLRTAGLTCEFVANETNWRLNSKSRRDIYAAAGPSLDLVTKAQHSGVARVGGCYPVMLPESSPLRQSQGVRYILHCLGPNFRSYDLTPGKQPVPSSIDAEGALRKCYENMLDTFISHVVVT